MTTPSPKIWDWLIDEVRAGAAEEILPRFRRLSSDMVSAKSAPDDLVTEADRQMEERLRVACARLMPQALFLGEEAVSADRRLLEDLPQAELAIVCDPVDGTWNFANGLAVFGVIIAVLRRGEPVFGLLYDPLGDDWVMAERAAGAFFARPGSAAERLSVQPGPAEQGVAGFVPLFLFPKQDRPRIAAGMAELGRATSLRCSCHEYRLLAQGRVDFNLSASLQPWDHIAGALAVEEAGGVARLADGSPYRGADLPQGPLVAAVSAEVHAEVVQRLQLRQ